MDMLKQTAALAIALTALTIGCDEEPASSGGNMDASTIDSGGDAAMSADTGRGDGGGGGSGDGYACNSWTPPAGDKCGGPHCQETLAEIKASASPSSVCGSDDEFAMLCSLEAVNATTECTVMLVSGASSTPIKDCTAQKLPTFSLDCIDCYVQSANCTVMNCFTACGGNSMTEICDTCREEKGCVAAFYTCAGYKNPLL